MVSYAQDGENHYSYLSDSPNETLGDTFYRNNEFLKCEARNYCKKREKVTRLDPLKKHAFFFQRENDSFIIPVFLQCHRSGTSTASMAEDLVPLVNETVLDQGDCVDEEGVEEAVSPIFVEDALKAIKGYENGCPKQETGKVERILDTFVDDFKNLTSPWTFFGGSGEKVEAGCLTNFLANIKTSVWETVKLFAYHLPTGAWNLGVSAFNKFMGREEETSSALLNSSLMSEDMADAITSFDFAKVYQLVRKNFWNFWGDIKEYYLETIGCTEWEGEPYYSTCLKKMNWSCPTVENMLTYACGFLSQVGTGFALGAIMGAARSLGAMANARRVMGRSRKGGHLDGPVGEEMRAKKFISESLSSISDKTRRGTFAVNRRMKNLTGFLDTSKKDVSFIMGAGESFRQLTASFPPTYLYNAYYQKGKNFGFKKANTAQYKRLTGGPLKRGQGLAFRFDSIRSSFDNIFDDLISLRGKKPFMSAEFRTLQKDLFDSITEQMKGTGVRVEKLPKGDGLVLVKGNEKFIYKPNFRRYLDPRNKQATSRLDNNEIKHLMTDRDPLLSNNPAITQSSRAPGFLKEMLEEANTARGVFRVKPDAGDGYLYLSSFGAQMSGMPEVEDCAGKMNGVKLIRTQDITDYPDDEEKAQIEAEMEAAEAKAAEAASH